MNTLEDLRSTLGQHAEDIHDDTETARVAAVRGRARAVRRRQGAAVAVAAALVVAGAALTLPQDRDIQPAPPTDQVPDSMTSLGATYGLADTQTGTDEVRLTLRAGDSPRLVTWGSERGPVEVRSNVTGSWAQRSTSPGDFSDFTLLSPQAEETLVVSGHGEVTVATYTLAEPAPGQTVDGITWRDEVAGGTRLGSVLGTPGQGRISLDLPAGDEQVQMHGFCVGPRDVAVRYTRDGQYLYSSQCGDAPGPDAATLGDSGPVEAGPGTYTATLISMKDMDQEDPAPVTDSADVRIGIAFYSIPAGDPVIEYDGHTWQRTAEHSGLGKVRAVLEPDGSPLLASGSIGGDVDSELLGQALVDGDVVGQFGSGISITAFAVEEDGRHDVAIREKNGEPVPVGLEVYRRLD